MSKQAIQTPNEEIETDDVEIVDADETIQIGEEGQESQETDEAEEIEIVVEGEEQPTSEHPPVPKGFLKRIGKLTEKLEVSKSEAEVLREENKALRAAIKPPEPEPSGPPKPGDFDTDEEYLEAQAKFNAEQTAKIVQETIGNVAKQAQQTTTQTQVAEKQTAAMTAHYERAEKLKVSDYEATEDTAIEHLGNDLTKAIMGHGRSEWILYHLGKNPVKASQFANLAETNPVQAMMDIGELAARLQPKPKRSSAPDPETKLPGSKGVGGGDDGPPGATFE